MRGGVEHNTTTLSAEWLDSRYFGKCCIRYMYYYIDIIVEIAYSLEI